MDPLLKVRNLCKNIGTLPVLKGVDLDVFPGEVVGLAGRSGAGKSAITMLLAGLQGPDQGEIYFDHIRCQYPFNARKLGIEVIHQKPELVEQLNVSSNIFMGNEISYPVFRNGILVFPQQQMDERSAEVLQQLGGSFLSLREKVANLSLEHRQLIAISRVMIKPARLIIIDDVTALLGYQYQQRVLDLIQTWQSEGTAVLFSSNNLDHLFAVTDRIIVLRDGVNVGCYQTDTVSREEVVSALVGTTDQQQITPMIWALDNFYRAQERAEKLRHHQMLLERDLAARDILNKQLLDQLNEQVIELDKAHKALQDAHLRLLSRRELERKQLARELHDESIQELLSVNYQLEAIEAGITVEFSVKEKLQDVRLNIRQLVEDLRGICRNLRPPTIDSLGLGSAIKSYANEFTTRTNMQVSLDIDPHLTRLPEATELSIFRIVQEAMRNVRKHSKATEVQVCLKHTSPRTIMITIMDNGIGLPKEFDLSRLANEGHYGLLGISERVALLGGHLNISNRIDGGAFVQVEIPHPRSKV